MNLAAPPRFSRRAWRLVRRNFDVWRKLIVSSIVVHIVEPVIFLFGLGFGVGTLVGDMDGGTYLMFAAAGMAGFSVMNSASFEALYSAFTRMHVQRTWSAILHAPMTLDDIVVGEWLWAGVKGTVSGAAMLIVLTVAGLAEHPTALWTLPVAAYAGLSFAGFALAFNAMARGFDFFLFYFSLYLTPMIILSGVFFPVASLPEVLQWISWVLPLRHLVDIFRPLFAGEIPANLLLNLFVLTLYGTGGLWLAAFLTRRRYLV